MIRKSVQRLSEKIMLKQRAESAMMIQRRSACRSERRILPKAGLTDRSSSM